MSEENNAGTDRAEGGDSSRLLLAALAMIAMGVGLWSWDDRRDQAAALSKPQLILAGQSR